MVSQIIDNVNTGSNFILKGGAGSGKTYTLIESIESLLTLKKRIAVITYTNAAKEEIIERLEKKQHKIEFCGTIHQFAWQIISNYKSELNVAYRSASTSHIIDRVVYKFKYDYGFSHVDNENGVIKLSHDEVLNLFKILLNSYPDLYKIISSMYDCVFVDEYQDTSQEVVDSLISNEFSSSVGFFGDSIQSIYSDTELNLTDVPILEKSDNWRSTQKLVDFFNDIRNIINQDTLQQQSRNIELAQIQSRMIYYEVEDLNSETITQIEHDNDILIDKALFLTHNLGISNEITPDINYNREFRNNQRKYTDDKSELYEHLVFLYDLNEMKLNKLFETEFVSKYYGVKLNQLSDVVEWEENISNLKRANTIGEIISTDIYNELNEKLKLELERLDKQMQVQFFNSMYDYSQQDNKYKTMFSMKGLEEDTILIYLNNGNWRNYNFQNMNERTKKLLYVALTRAKKNLIIITNKNLDDSLKTIIDRHFEKKQLN